MKTWQALAFVALLLLAANQRAALLQLAAPSDDDAPEPLTDAPAEDDGSPQLEATQGTGSAFSIAAMFSDLDPAALLAPGASDVNRSAFLRMIRFAEGTDSTDGYRTMFGYRYFNDWSDHPRQPAQFTDKAGRKLWTSAAGAYQFMAVSPIPGGGSTRVDTWDRLQASLGLPDFSPASQDAAALELIRQAGALPDVDAGRLDVAVGKVRRIWASLPGAGYAQGERSLASLQNAYRQAGGTIAA